MKKLKEFGRALSRNEMKSVSGGLPPGGGDCLYNSSNPCAPLCAYKPDGTPVALLAYACVPVSGGGGKCVSVSCNIIE